LFWIGLIMAVITLVPPLGAWARRWVVGEATQFSVLAYIVPALLVLGLPAATRERLAVWPALSKLVKSSASPDGRAPAQSRRTSRSRFDPLVDRPGRGPFDPAAARAWIALVVFVGLVALWRSPAAVDALARHETLVLLEAATLVASGGWLWLNLLDSGAAVSGAGHPRRMTIAALAMWSIWVLAFVVGFSGHPMFSAYHHQTGSGLSSLADQELAVWVLWAVPGLALAPVVFVNLASWLRAQESGPSGPRAAEGRAGP
jgi:cytochrome c oxidase assembly factor CtaG